MELRRKIAFIAILVGILLTSLPVFVFAQVDEESSSMSSVSYNGTGVSITEGVNDYPLSQMVSAITYGAGTTTMMSSTTSYTVLQVNVIAIVGAEPMIWCDGQSFWGYYTPLGSMIGDIQSQLTSQFMVYQWNGSAHCSSNLEMYNGTSAQFYASVVYVPYDTRLEKDIDSTFYYDFAFFATIALFLLTFIPMGLIWSPFNKK